MTKIDNEVYLALSQLGRGISKLTNHSDSNILYPASRCITTSTNGQYDIIDTTTIGKYARAKQDFKSDMESLIEKHLSIISDIQNGL